MSIRLHRDLPAASQLSAEGYPVAGLAERAAPEHGSVRIGLLNLMPDKPATELQLARMLALPGLDVELTLLSLRTYAPKHTSRSHMDTFYVPWDQHLDDGFDGVIITGAPVETLEFEGVAYWTELTRVLDWASQRAGSTLCICWSAQAALYHFYGVPKQMLDQKCFGVFPQKVLAAGKYLRGLEQRFWIPVSRHSEVRAQDLQNVDVNVLSTSSESGLCLVEDELNRMLCMFNHFEYETQTLHGEYSRDRDAGKPIAPPVHYYENDDPAGPVRNTWAADGRRFFANWLMEAEQQAESRRWTHRSALARAARLTAGARGGRKISHRPTRREPAHLDARSKAPGG